MKKMKCIMVYLVVIAMILPLMSCTSGQQQEENPDKKIIKLGIGDVTLPIVPAVGEAIKKATDDCSLAENCGADVCVTEGSYKNIKITTPEDMSIAEIFLGRE